MEYNEVKWSKYKVKWGEMEGNAVAMESQCR